MHNTVFCNYSHFPNVVLIKASYSIIFYFTDTEPTKPMSVFPARGCEEDSECELRCITRRPRFALVPVHEQPVPGSAEHAAQLGDGEGVDVLADCGDTHGQGEG